VAGVACDSDKGAEPKAAVAHSAEKPAKKAEASEAAPTKAAAAEPEDPAPAVEVSDAMKAFMSELGEHDKVTAALNKHGAEGLEADMGQYNIGDPVVTGSNPGQAAGETCYAMQAKTGAVQRKFELCWTDGKITRAENKGLAL
jgi:hypothetical protein